MAFGSDIYHNVASLLLWTLTLGLLYFLWELISTSSDALIGALLFSLIVFSRSNRFFDEELPRPDAMQLFQVHEKYPWPWIKISMDKNDDDDDDGVDAKPSVYQRILHFPLDVLFGIFFVIVRIILSFFASWVIGVAVLAEAAEFFGASKWFSDRLLGFSGNSIRKFKSTIGFFLILALFAKCVLSWFWSWVAVVIPLSLVFVAWPALFSWWRPPDVKAVRELVETGWTYRGSLFYIVTATLCCSFIVLVALSLYSEALSQWHAAVTFISSGFEYLRNQSQFFRELTGDRPIQCTNGTDGDVICNSTSGSSSFFQSNLMIYALNYTLGANVSSTFIGLASSVEEIRQHNINISSGPLSNATSRNTTSLYLSVLNAVQTLRTYDVFSVIQETLQKNEKILAGVKDALWWLWDLITGSQGSLLRGVGHFITFALTLWQLAFLPRTVVFYLARKSFLLRTRGQYEGQLEAPTASDGPADVPATKSMCVAPAASGVFVIGARSSYQDQVRDAERRALQIETRLTSMLFELALSYWHLFFLYFCFTFFLGKAAELPLPTLFAIVFGILSIRTQQFLYPVIVVALFSAVSAYIRGSDNCNSSLLTLIRSDTLLMKAPETWLLWLREHYFDYAVSFEAVLSVVCLKWFFSVVAALGGLLLTNNPIFMTTTPTSPRKAPRPSRQKEKAASHAGPNTERQRSPKRGKNSSSSANVGFHSVGRTPIASLSAFSPESLLTNVENEAKNSFVQFALAWSVFLGMARWGIRGLVGGPLLIVAIDFLWSANELE